MVAAFNVIMFLDIRVKKKGGLSFLVLCCFCNSCFYFYDVQGDLPQKVSVSAAFALLGAQPGGCCLDKRRKRKGGVWVP